MEGAAPRTKRPRFRRRAPAEHRKDAETAQQFATDAHHTASILPDSSVDKLSPKPAGKSRKTGGKESSRSEIDAITEALTRAALQNDGRKDAPDAVHANNTTTVSGLGDERRRRHMDPAERERLRQERKAARAREAELAADRERAAVAMERERASMGREEEEERGGEERREALFSLRSSAEGRVEERRGEARRREKLRAAHQPAVLNELRSLRVKRALRSDVKKSTAMVKRVVGATEETLPGIAADMAAYNLSRYASEIASSIIASDRWKVTDVGLLVGLVSPMHQRYEDFTSTLLHSTLAQLISCLRAAVVPVGATPSQVAAAHTAISGVINAISAAKGRVPVVTGEGVDIEVSVTADFDVLSGSAPVKRSSGPAVPGAGSASSDQSAAFCGDPKNAAARARFLIRLLVELYSVSVYTDGAGLVSIIVSLLGQDFAALSGSKPAAESSEESDTVLSQRHPTLPAVPKSAEAAKMTTQEVVNSMISAVNEKSARKAARDLPLALRVLQSCPVDFFGRMPRSDRTWWSDFVDAHGRHHPKEVYSLVRYEQLPNSGDISVGVAATGMPTFPLDFVHAWSEANVAGNATFDLAVAVVTTRPGSIIYPPEEATTYGTPVLSDIPAPKPLPNRVGSLFFQKAEQELLVRAADRYFDCVAKALILEYIALKTVEKRADLWQFSKGSLPEKMAKELEGQRASFERLSASVAALADLIDRDMPEYPEVVLETEPSGVVQSRRALAATEFGPFDDAVVRSFYKDIPDLREALPAVLFEVETAGASTGEQSSSHMSAAPGATIGRSSLARDDTKHIKGTLDGALGQLSDSRKKAQNAAVPPAQPAAAPKPVPVSAPTPTSPTKEAPANAGALSRLIGVKGEAGADEDVADDGDKKYKPSAQLLSFLGTGGDNDAILEDDVDDSASSSVKSAASVKLADMIARLPRTASRELSDAWCMEFIQERLNTKANRGKIIRAIFSSATGGDNKNALLAVSTDTLPYYARIVAVLNTALPGFANPLLALLADELRFLISRLSAPSKKGIDAATGMNAFESRALRNTKLLAELTKFGVAPPTLLFGAMHRSLTSFTQESINVLCTALEYAGKYLLLLPDTQEHMLRFLDTLKKARQARNALPGTGSLADAIDAALYFVLPPEKAPMRAGKIRTTMEAFIRHLVLDRLAEHNADDVVRIIRKLPWNSTMPAQLGSLREGARQSVEDVIVRTVLAGLRLDATKLELVASLVAGLKVYHERVAVRIIDAVIEKILDHISDEHMQTASRRSQKMLGAVRFLGECYNYKLCDSSLIFRMLYTIINCGHDVSAADRQAAVDGINRLLEKVTESGMFLPEHMRAMLPPAPLILPPEDPGVGGWGYHPLVESKADPPTHVFRIRMVCVLLESCASYFSRGALGMRLDRFLVFFQRYALSKTSVPIDTEFAVADIFQSLRPSMRRFANFAEAEEAASELERQEAFAAAENALAAPVGSNWAVSYDVGQQHADEEDEDDDDDDDTDDDDEVGHGDEMYVGGDDAAAAHEEQDDITDDDEEISDSDQESAGSDHEDYDDGDADSDSEQPAEEDEGDDFDKELSRMIKDSVDSRRGYQANARATIDMLSLPAFEPTGASPAGTSGAVTLTVLNRSRPKAGGGRMEAHQLVVPRGVALAESAIKSRAEMLEEARWLKQRTLQLHEEAELAEVARRDADVRAARFHRARESAQVIVDSAKLDVPGVQEESPSNDRANPRGHRERGRGGRGRGGRGRD